MAVVDVARDQRDGSGGSRGDIHVGNGSDSGGSDGGELWVADGNGNGGDGGSSDGGELWVADGNGNGGDSGSSDG
ncbi:hypothetical protein Pcinc_025450, partial [Petrolisthes cinctipes]